jgi:hypothetical protein
MGRGESPIVIYIQMYQICVCISIESFTSRNNENPERSRSRQTLNKEGMLRVPNLIVIYVFPAVHV